MSSGKDKRRVSHKIKASMLSIGDTYPELLNTFAVTVLPAAPDASNKHAIAYRGHRAAG
jgi:hypothetical protein